MTRRIVRERSDTAAGSSNRTVKAQPLGHAERLLAHEVRVEKELASIGQPVQARPAPCLAERVVRRLVKAGGRLRLPELRAWLAVDRATLFLVIDGDARLARDATMAWIKESQ